MNLKGYNSIVLCKMAVGESQIVKLDFNVKIIKRFAYIIMSFLRNILINFLFGRVLKEMLPCDWFAEIYTYNASYTRSFNCSFKYPDSPRLQPSLGSFFKVFFS
jgi:hypothetical protein